MNATHEENACTAFSNARMTRLAQAVQGLSSGEQAQLRRMSDRQTPPSAFYRLLLQHVHPAWNGPEHEEKWQTVLQGMAIMALAMPDGPVHVHRRSPGAVLGQMLASSAEMRFWRLLEAEGPLFYDLMRHMVRMLARERRPVDWGDMARLCLLSFGGKSRSVVQRRLARDFINAQNHSEQQGAAS